MDSKEVTLVCTSWASGSWTLYTQGKAAKAWTSYALTEAYYICAEVFMQQEKC